MIRADDSYRIRYWLEFCSRVVENLNDSRGIRFIGRLTARKSREERRG